MLAASSTETMSSRLPPPPWNESAETLKLLSNIMYSPSPMYSRLCCGSGARHNHNHDRNHDHDQNHSHNHSRDHSRDHNHNAANGTQPRHSHGVRNRRRAHTFGDTAARPLVARRFNVNPRDDST